MNPKSNVSPTPAADGSAAAPAPAAVPDQPPIYGQTSYDSGARYPLNDPTDLPLDDGGVVKLGIMKFPDMPFIRDLQAENDALIDNPNYLTPSPSIAEMNAAIADLQAKSVYVTTLKSMLKDATNSKDVSRATAEGLYKMRAAYVQLTSNGNTNLILNAGFAVRSTGTPVGPLPPPTGLILDLNGTQGVMFLRWTPVTYSRGYNIQCSPANTMERNWTAFETTTASRHKCENMTLGQVYAFRIAAVGGSTGQSDWSAEVIRMAA